MQLFVYEIVSALLSVSVSAESKQYIMAMGVQSLGRLKRQVGGQASCVLANEIASF